MTSEAKLLYLETKRIERELEAAAAERKARRLAAIAALPEDTAHRTVRTVRGYHGTMRVEQRGCCPVASRPDRHWFMEV